MTKGSNMLLRTSLPVLAGLLLAGSAGADAPRVTLDTSEGSIVLELDRDAAPETVDNFLGYVDSGFYDGTIFHRVIAGFMIQGGGFTREYRRKPTGAPVRNEADNGRSNARYTVAMARTNEPHSATSQFFINTADNPHLDFRGATMRGWGYAVFGRVVEGREVVDRIASVRTGAGGPFSRDTPRAQVLIDNAHRVDDDIAVGDTDDMVMATDE